MVSSFLIYPGEGYLHPLFLLVEMSEFAFGIALPINNKNHEYL